jgi:pimeloyl-ACP methyl ester carboxylesterase
MEPHSRFIDVGGIKLHVADWGGSGPDLLLLHANGFLGWVYRKMIVKFAGRYHVYTLDLRGQGDSEKPALDQDHWKNMARDVEKIIDCLGLRDFYGIGHSGGGALLALYAATHPRRVRRLALLEPVTIPHEPPYLDRLSVENHPFAERALRRRVVWDTRQQLFDAYQGKDAFAAWDEDVLWDYVNHGTYSLPDGRVALKCPAEVEAHVFAYTSSIDIFSRLNTIDCPVLVLRGALTGEPLYGIAERVAQRIPQGSLMTVSGTGHFLAMEKPGEVAEIIASYFRAA